MLIYSYKEGQCLSCALPLAEPPCPLSGSRVAVQDTQIERPRTHWSEVLPFLFSRTVLFSTLAAFSAYWALALYLSWNPVYLVNVRHLRLSYLLYLAGIMLPFIVGAITLIVFGALADRAFYRTGSQRRSRVYLVTLRCVIQ